MRLRFAPKPKAGRKKSCGNAGSVERMESQKQASHSFHEPLGNLANSVAEIPTFPQLLRRRRMETCKTKSRFFTFPTATDSLSLKAKKTGPRNGLRPPPGGGRSA